MKNLGIVFMTVVLSCTAFAYEDGKTRISSEKAICSEKSCSVKNRRKCSCYCSVKCGPREIIKKQDKPVFATQDSKGNQIPAQCYCNQLDVDKYNENCIAREPEQDTEQE